MSYILINKLTTKPGKRDKMVDILLESTHPFLTNRDCIMSTVSVDKSDETTIWVQDIWTNKEAHEAAMQDETIQSYVKKSLPLLEGMPEQREVDYKGGKLQ